MSEAERQVSRRGACLAVVCERLEETICNNGAALEPAADGVNPHVILRQAGKVLNAIALAKGGHTVGELAKLPADQLAVVTDLLTRAGDLSSRAITAENGVLELYGLMADRCSRTFQRIGLQRRPRDLTELAEYASEQSFSPLRQQMRDEATDAETVEEVSEAAE